MNQTNSSNINTTTNTASNCALGYLTKSTRTGLTCAYLMIFIAAFIGNSVVIYVVRSKSKLKIPFNYFILSMATADLLHAFLIIPLSITYLYVHTLWFSGPFALFLCKFFHFGAVVGIIASITTLMVTTVERFLAARLILKRPISMTTTRVLVAGVWIYSLLASIYEAVKFRVIRTRFNDFHCVPVIVGDRLLKIQVEMTLKAVFTYVIPLVTMATLYTNIIWLLWRHGSFSSLNTEHYRSIQKRKKNLIKRLIFITLIFAVCWFPVHVNHIVGAFYYEVYVCLPQYWVLLFYWIAHANSAINPFLYLLLTRNARALFRSTVHVAKHDGNDGSRRTGSRKMWMLKRFPSDSRLLTACISSQNTDSQEGKDNEMYELNRRSPFT